ncbi:MAG TPA: AmmeMemoRadiSam system protein B [Thermoprotei archaeon]|nr:AmmeMemoRadiSam system protein B [Thermoprotei archaeon]
MYVRRPSASGFYPMSGPELRRAINAAATSKFGPGFPLTPVKGKDEIKILGFVVPHAGYSYSGPIAAHAYAELSSQGAPDSVIIMGPNHMGYPGTYIMKEGKWETPFGIIDVDAALSNSIIDRMSTPVDTNPLAQDGEHSIEVQIPFLQSVLGDKFKLVPISMGTYTPQVVKELGEAIAGSVKMSGKDVILFATTDFTHYGLNYGYTPVGLNAKTAKKWVYEVDNKLIELIVSMKADELLETVASNGYTMCGSGPVAALLIALKRLGVKEGRLLKYATSYDIAGGEEKVDAMVGYAAIDFPKS